MVHRQEIMGQLTEETEALLVISRSFPFLTAVLGFAMFALLLYPPTTNRGARLCGNSGLGGL